MKNRGCFQAGSEVDDGIRVGAPSGGPIDIARRQEERVAALRAAEQVNLRPVMLL